MPRCSGGWKKRGRASEKVCVRKEWVMGKEKTLCGAAFWGSIFGANLVLVFGFDFFHATHVRTEAFGNGDGAVFVLVHFHDGDEDTWGCDDGVVECVADLDFAIRITVAEVEATGLVFVEA